MSLRVSLLILLLALGPVSADAPPVDGGETVRGVETKIEQKLRMLGHLLLSPQLTRRAKASDDPLAAELIARSRANHLLGKQYLERGQMLEAQAVLDFALRDLSAGTQLLNVSRRKQDKYHRFLEQLDSLALPDWETTSDGEDEGLQARFTQLDDRRKQALRLAGAGAYDEATALLQQAYRIKVALLEDLRDEKTIVYGLDFDSIQDEYQYAINRGYHYLELVHLVLSRAELEEWQRVELDDHLRRAMVDIETAEHLEIEGKFGEAVTLLEQSIEHLASILRLVGVDI